jgi:hypothetical protein
MGKSTGGRRVWRICAASLLAASLTTLIVSQAYGASSSSSGSTTSTTTATPNALPTSPGSAIASSSVLTTGPQFGGYNLSVTAGSSAASLQGDDANASSQDVNLGTLGTALTGPNSCTGAAGTNPFSVLDALTADSGGGATSKTGGQPAGGTENVSVNPSPESATAETTPVSIGIPGLLDLIGQATATVAYNAGQGQGADAKTILSLNLGNGLVTIDGLTWTASQHLGATPVNTASFTAASIDIGSTKLPTATQAELETAISAVNKVLALLGLTITLPTISTDSETGAITVSGLDLKLQATATTTALLEPLLAQEPKIEELLDGSVASNCELATYAGDAELVGDVILSALAGAGQTNLILGGAGAETGAAPATFQFGTSGSSNLGSSSIGSGAFPTVGSSGISSALGAVATPGTTATTIPSGSTSATPASVPAGLVRCVTTSPSGRPGCWRNAGGIVAGILLAGGAALFAVDFVQGRRRRFERPKESPL